MADTKISALTAATTPLAGTEVLPIVQSGTTVKATVANITGAGAYAGSFTSLAYTTTLTGGTGIVNLGSGQFYKNATGNIGIGTTSVTGYSLRIAKTITGVANSYGVFVDGVTQSDVTASSNVFYTSASTQAAAFTLGSLLHYAAVQTTLGASSIVTNQYGFFASSLLTGATNNYGFFGGIAAPTSGISTAGTITSISSSTTTVTVNHNAITYTNGQIVTISATANATALTSGATCTILTVGSTDFTLIGAASNTVGVSFTATGSGTGTGTVTLNVQGSSKTVAGAASGSFTYTTTTSQTFAAITVLTGSITVSKRYNLYMSGTAPNWFSGDVLVFGAGGLGYTTGSGGTVTQATSRTTGVTLNKTNGAITLVSAAGLATFQSFTVTNSTVAATDVVNVTQKSGTDLYQIFVTATAAGSFQITYSTTGGVTVEQPVFNFAIIKGVTA